MLRGLGKIRSENTAIVGDIQGLSVNQLLCLRKLAELELKETNEAAAALKYRLYLSDIDAALREKEQDNVTKILYNL